MSRVHFFSAGPNGRFDSAWPVAATLAVALLLPGCAERKPRAYPWATALVVRPRKPAPAPGYVPTQPEEAAPDLQLDFPPPPSKLVVVRFPVRPRVAAPQAPVAAAPEKAETLSLAPQMSEQEIAAAQGQTNASLAVAQRNLAAAKGRKLNATQLDLTSKVHSFIEESKEAARDGDWNRARNFAKKAQVLSEELADSL